MEWYLGQMGLTRLDELEGFIETSFVLVAQEGLLLLPQLSQDRHHDEKEPRISLRDFSGVPFRGRDLAALPSSDGLDRQSSG